MKLPVNLFSCMPIGKRSELAGGIPEVQLLSMADPGRGTRLAIPSSYPESSSKRSGQLR